MGIAERHANHKFHSVGADVVGGNRSVVESDELIAEVESNARTHRAFFLVALIEAFPEVLDVGFVEVRTAVVDADFEVLQDVWIVEGLLSIVCNAVHAAGGAHDDAPIGWRELEGVGKEVGQHFFEVDRVEPNLHALFFGLRRETDVLGSGKSREGRHHVVGIMEEFYFLEFQVELSVVDFAHVGDLVHHAQHTVAVALHHPVALLVLFVAVFLLQFLER